MRAVLPILSLVVLAAAWPALAQEQAAQDQTAQQQAPPAPSASTEVYDSRVRQSFAAAESFQGPLDGGWTLAAGEGRLFAIQFSDREGRLEAAWRDLRRAGALESSGFVDEVERAGGRLTLRFASAAGVRDVAVLTPGPGNRWSGELVENGRRVAVTLAKTAP